MNWHIPVLNWIKNTLLFTSSTNILVRLLTVEKSENVLPYSSNSVENATPLYLIQSRKCDSIQRHIPVSLL